MDEIHNGGNGTRPVLVATTVNYCITHQATDHDGRAWTACRFRQLFYFENPMDEHTLMWADHGCCVEGASTQCDHSSTGGKCDVCGAAQRVHSGGAQSDA